MSKHKHHKHNHYHGQSKAWSRRKFLGTSACAAMGLSTFMSTFLDLRMANAMAASNITPLNDYKALVCILLAGGNDSYNMLVPRGQTEYQEYASVRSTIALPQGDILPIYPTTSIGKDLGVHPSMPEVQQLFNNGNLAFVSNVGTLVEPVTKMQYFNGTGNLPLGLMSHADQIQQWQTSIPNDRSALGWGGRMADILKSMNTNQQVSMSLSMSGNNLFQAGGLTTPYSVDPFEGAGKSIWDYGNTADGWAMLKTGVVDEFMSKQYSNLFEQTYADIIKDSQAASNMYNAAIVNANVTSPFTSNTLSKSMEMVAKTIAVRNNLGFSRQTFFIVFGGWDNHKDIATDHQALLGVVSKAMQELYDSTVELGVENDVTCFTISDFGRTLTSNGDGTDHGWGGNAMVMGGAVKGAEIYGTYPDLYDDNSIDVGEGRGILIPTTSADEYFAELAMWFGVSPTDLPLVLPNINNFYSPSLSSPPIGFLL